MRVQVLLIRLDREPLEAFLYIQSAVWGFTFLTLPPGALRTPFLWAYCLLYLAQGCVGVWALLRWRYTARRACVMLGACLWTFSACVSLMMKHGAEVLALYYALMAAVCILSFVRAGLRHAP